MDRQAVLKIVFEAIDKATPIVTKLGKELGLAAGPLKALSALGHAAFTGLAAGAGLAAAGLASMFDAAKDFNQSMANVRAVLKVTPDEFRKLSDEVLRLGRETRFTSDQAANAVEALARGGATYKEVMSGAGQAALELAAATKAGMTESAAVIMSVMHQFNIEGKDLGRAADAIAGAVNSANMNLTDFSYALMNSGSIAHEMGMGLDEVSAALAQFGQEGYVGERAGTGLKIMLTNLVPKTEKAAAAMEKYGLIVNGQNQFFDKTTGKLIHMAEIYDLLEKSFGGMGTAAKMAAFKEIWGQRAATVGMVIEAAQGGKAKYQEFLDVIHSTKSSEIAEARMNSLAGAWEKLAGEIETAKVVLMSALIPLDGTPGILQKMTEGLESIVSAAQPMIRVFAEWMSAGLEGIPQWLADMGIDVDKFARAFEVFEGTDFATGLHQFLRITIGKDNRKNVEDFIKNMQDLWTTLTSKESQENFSKFVDDSVRLIGAVSTGIQDIRDFGTELGKIMDAEGEKFGGKRGGSFDTVSKGGFLSSMVGDPVAAGQEARLKIQAFRRFVDEQLAEANAGFRTVGPGGAGEEAGGMMLGDINTRVDEAVAAWRRLPEQLMGIAGEVNAVISGITTSMGSQTQTWVDDLSAKGTTLQETSNIVWGQVQDNVNTAVSNATISIQVNSGLWLAEMQAKGQAILEDTQMKWGEVQVSIMGFTAGILLDVQTKSTEIKADLAAKWVLVSADTMLRWNEIKTNVSTKIDETKTNVATTSMGLYNDLSARWNDVVQDTNTKWAETKNWVETHLRTAFESAETKGREICEELDRRWQKLVEDTERWWSELPKKAGEYLSQVVDKVVEWAKKAYDEAVEMGKDMARGIKEGFVEKLESLAEDFWSSVQSIINYLFSMIGAQSPATELMPLGMYAAQGIGVGFVDEMPIQGKRMGESLVKAIRRMGPIVQRESDALSQLASIPFRSSLGGGGPFGSGLTGGGILGSPPPGAGTIADIASRMAGFRGRVAGHNPPLQTGPDQSFKGGTAADKVGLGELLFPPTARKPGGLGGNQGAAKFQYDLTKSQMEMLDPFKDFDVDKMRRLRKMGMNLNQTGKGGFIAASRTNFFKKWSERNWPNDAVGGAPIGGPSPEPGNVPVGRVPTPDMPRVTLPPGFGRPPPGSDRPGIPGDPMALLPPGFVPQIKDFITTVIAAMLPRQVGGATWTDPDQYPGGTLPDSVSSALRDFITDALLGMLPGQGGDGVPLPAGDRLPASVDRLPASVDGVPSPAGDTVFVLEVNGIMVGKWNIATEPDRDRQADRHTNL